MKKLYFGLIAIFLGTSAYAQTSSCTQVLRLVRTTYEQGRLHELPKLVEGCLKSEDPNKSFTKAEKREAYRYLTLSYIYLEEPEAADSMMLKLLETDHFYQVNDLVDPAEFVALYNKFRVDPVFRLGMKLGLNITQPTVLNYYNVGSTAGGQGTYGMKPAFNVYLSYEHDLGKKTLRSTRKKFVMTGEIGLVTRNYNYTNNDLGTLENPKGVQSVQEGVVSQSWIDVNAIAQYKLKNTINLQTYIGFGPGISYLLSSNNQANTTLANSFTVTGPSVDDSKVYNKLVYSATVVAGLKYKVGELYVTGEARYQVGFSNVVNPSSRTNPELAFDYQMQYNDYRMSNFAINIGVIYPYFKPKKLIK